MLTRRELLRAAAISAAACAVPRGVVAAPPAQPKPGAPKDSASVPPPFFRISLAQWSLHRALQKNELDPIEFPKMAKQTFGLEGVEYVNVFLMSDYPKETTPRGEGWFADLKRRCGDLGVTSVLIMCDALGALGHPEEAKRLTAVQRHHAWIDRAKFLGCHSIRVNAQSEGTWEEQRGRAADGLHRLCEYADPLAMSVIVENHGGLSSNGKWLAETIRAADHPRCGTLPDFGNFNLGEGKSYDRYQGVTELMPFAKGVSAKSHDFDEAGNERSTDYPRMLKIVLDAGYRGWIGVEYEGDRLSEPEGIRATKTLLEKVREASRA